MEHAEEFKKILIEKVFSELFLFYYYIHALFSFQKEIAGIKIKNNKLNIKEHDPLNKSSENERQQYVNTLTKQSFLDKNLEKYSNKLLVTGLPTEVTREQVSELFPHHLSLDLKHAPKLRAIITYSSSKEAMQARKNVRPIIDGQKIRVILLLVEDSFRKRKTFDNEVPSPAKPADKTATDTSKAKKAKKKEPHAFVRPLRYFEAGIE